MTVGQHLVSYKVMQTMAHPGKAVAGISTKIARGFERLPWIEAPGKVPIVDAQADPCGLVFGDFGRHLPVAAPLQHAEPDLAMIFGCTASVDRKPRVMLVAGGDAPTFGDLQTVRQRLTSQMHFVKPATGDVRQTIVDA